TAAEVRASLEGLGKSDPAVCALAVDRGWDGWGFSGAMRLQGESAPARFRRGPVKDPAAITALIEGLSAPQPSVRPPAPLSPPGPASGARPPSGSAGARHRRRWRSC